MHQSNGYGPLPDGIRSRMVEGVNGLRMHVLEAGQAAADRPCVLLLHGFPELAYSWRKVLPALAQAGYYVIAPDQRGYGRSTGWESGYDSDLTPFRMFNLVRDAVGLVHAVGYRGVAAVVGHDFGSPVAAWCALLRPDMFHSVVLMSAPFAGPPALPSNSANGSAANAGRQRASVAQVLADLAALPRARKHYQWYYSTRQANHDMWHCAQGIGAFLRAYYHVKSADWPGNLPHALPDWSAASLAQMPRYYVMDHDQDMAQTVAGHMPSSADVAACRWLPEEALALYSSEFGRTGFQGALQWYRCATSGLFLSEMQTFAGASIDVPACFIAGSCDWGVYQKPGDFELMQAVACTRMLGCHLVSGAGHWVQQEQPLAVTNLLLQFLAQAETVPPS